MSAPDEERAVPLRLALDAMGTRFELVLVDDGLLPSADLHALGEEALEEIRICDARYSAFRRDSERSRIARESTQLGGAQLSSDSAALLGLCRELWRASGGAFDPALGSGFADLELDVAARRARSARGSCELDFGGIAKGWALDHASALLQAAGVRRALLHGGTSSVVALGAPPGAAGWSIALRDPTRAANATPIARVQLCDLALGVSAPHGRRGADGRGHVLDPRDGGSAEAPLAAVLHPSAAIADAWSTALLVRVSRSWRAPLDADTIAAPLAPWPGEQPTCFWIARAGSAPLLRGPRASLFSVLPERTTDPT